MIDIDFHYDGSVIPFQSQKEEIMKNIINNFCRNESINISQVFFLYDGKIIDEKLPLKSLINRDDKQRKKMNILILLNSEKNKNNNSSRKTKQTICPRCGENAQIKFKNYLVTIYGCKNNHIIENIPLEQYEKTQIIDEGKIICCFCKNANKKNSFNQIFYFCGTCKQNICPICKDYHNKNHNIIDYDLKGYTCFEHGDNFNSYCDTCKKNICIACENDHSNHYIISFGKNIPKKENLKEKNKEFKDIIEKFKDEINQLKNILNYVVENLDNYYNIINNIYNSFEIKKRNYEILNNINEIKFDEIKSDFQEIINDTIQNKFYKINIIYNKMKNDIRKNLSSNYDFNFMGGVQIISSIPMNINPFENSMIKLIREFNELKGINFGKNWGIPGFNLWTLNNNPFIWVFTLRGLNYYSEGKFYIKAIFPQDYPKSRPEFCFVTPMYHLNVFSTQMNDESLGHICTTILIWWNPNTKIKDIIIDVLSFFWGENPESPCIHECLKIADLYKNNTELYFKRVKYFTKKYADPSLPYKEYNSWDFSVPEELKYN